MLSELVRVEDRKMFIELSRKESLPFSSYLVYQAMVFYILPPLPQHEGWRGSRMSSSFISPSTKQDRWED